MKKGMKKAAAVGLALVLTAGLAACGSGSSGSSADSSSSGEKKTLTIVTWQDYGANTEEFVTKFEEENNCEVVFVPMASEVELLTKLRNAEPGEYDLCLPNCMILKTAIEEGLLTEIDTSSLSNWDGLYERFQQQAECYGEDGKLYSVPWVWGSTAIAYNTDYVSEAPTSIGCLFDEQYAGHIAMNDDSATAIETGALYLGQDPNNPSDLDAVKEALTAQKPLNYSYWTTGDEFSKVFATNEVWIALFWSGQSASMMAEGLPIGYTVPQDGAFGWVDTWGIPSCSENQDLALKYIDMLIGEEFQSYWINNGGPAPCNKAAGDAIDPDTALAYGIDEDSLNRLTFVVYHSDEELITWDELWTEVKAG